MKNLTVTEQLYFNALHDSGDIIKRSTFRALKAPEPKRDSNVVDVHMKNLRRKVKRSGYTIITVRGKGYQLVRD